MTVRPPMLVFVSLRAPNSLATTVALMLAVKMDVANCATSSLAVSPVRLSPMNFSAVSSIRDSMFSRPAVIDGGTSPLFAIEPMDLPSLRKCDSHARPSGSTAHSRCTSAISSSSFFATASFRKKDSVVSGLRIAAAVDMPLVGPLAS